MKHLVYVHGTNGSGKSTLARAVGAAAGGVTEYRPTSHTRDLKVGTSWTAAGVALMGQYVTKCGGVDGIHPYAAVLDELLKHAIFPQARCFAEGLLTPGVETCTKMAGYFEGNATFIVLDTPVDDCIAHVLARRRRKGTTAEYNPANLYKKHQSARNWGDRLERNGLVVRRLKYPQAYRLCLELLGLPMPSVKELL